MTSDNDSEFETPFDDEGFPDGCIESSNLERAFPVQTKDGIVLVTLPKVFFIHVYFWRAIKKTCHAISKIFRIFETDRHRIKHEFVMAECKRCLDETWKELEDGIMSRGHEIFEYFHLLRSVRNGTTDPNQLNRAKELGCRMDSTDHTLADLIARKAKVYDAVFYRKTVFAFLDEMSKSIDSLCKRGMPTEELKSFLAMKRMAEFELNRDMVLAENEVAACRKHLAPELLEEANELYQNEISQHPQESPDQQLAKSMDKIKNRIEQTGNTIASSPVVLIQGNGNHVSLDHAIIGQTNIIRDNSQTISKGDFEAAKNELLKIPELNDHVEELIALLREVKDKPLDEKKRSVTSWIDSLKKKLETSSRKVMETATISFVLKVIGDLLGISFL